MVDPPRRRASRPPPRAIFSEQESSRIFRRLRGGGEAERGILGPVDGEAATPIIKRRRYSNWSQYFKRGEFQWEWSGPRNVGIVTAGNVEPETFDGEKARRVVEWDDMKFGSHEDLRSTKYRFINGSTDGIYIVETLAGSPDYPIDRMKRKALLEGCKHTEEDRFTGLDGRYEDGRGDNVFFNTPADVAVDGKGHVYVCDHENHVIRCIRPTGKTVTYSPRKRHGRMTGLQDGNPYKARFHYPTSIDTDEVGNLAVADLFNDAIRIVSAPGFRDAGIDDPRKRPPFHLPKHPDWTKVDWNLIMPRYNWYPPHSTRHTVVETVVGEGPIEYRNISWDFANGSICLSSRMRLPLRPINTQASLTPTAVAIENGTRNVYFNGQGSLIYKLLRNPPVSLLALPISHRDHETYSQTYRKDLGYVFRINSSDLTASYVGLVKHNENDWPKGLSIEIGSSEQGEYNQVNLGEEDRDLSLEMGGSRVYYHLPKELSNRSGIWYLRMRGAGRGARLFGPGLNFGGTPREKEARRLIIWAGDGEPGHRDGAAWHARFKSPSALAIAPDKTMYITDRNLCNVRKISPNLQVTTLAGPTHGQKTSGLRDGRGSQALFWNPNGIAVSRAGNVYVADTNNHRIRKILPNGEVSSFAGGMKEFSQSLDLNAKIHPMNRITQFSMDFGMEDGAAEYAGFRTPWGVAVDNDEKNVYVADTGNQRICKIFKKSLQDLNPLNHTKNEADEEDSDDQGLFDTESVDTNTRPEGGNTTEAVRAPGSAGSGARKQAGRDDEDLGFLLPEEEDMPAESSAQPFPEAEHQPTLDQSDPSVFKGGVISNIDSALFNTTIETTSRENKFSNILAPKLDALGNIEFTAQNEWEGLDFEYKGPAEESAFNFTQLREKEDELNIQGAGDDVNERFHTENVVDKGQRFGIRSGVGAEEENRDETNDFFGEGCEEDMELDDFFRHNVNEGPGQAMDPSIDYPGFGAGGY